MTTEPVRTALSHGPCPSFPKLAARYLEEYLEKIRRAVDLLDDDQVWWRPAPDSNSIGNLLLHLAGNLSLWLRAGLGGDAFERDRAVGLTAVADAVVEQGTGRGLAAGEEGGAQLHRAAGLRRHRPAVEPEGLDALRHGQEGHEAVLDGRGVVVQPAG